MNISRQQSALALLISIPIGLLGGLIGLGGAEFRLPVLVGMLKRQAKEAVLINLSISFITVITSFVIRMQVLTNFPLMDLLPILLSMIFGAVLAAFFAAGAVSKVSNRALENWMKFLLIAIGLLLIVEGFIPILSADLQHGALLAQFLVGITTGILIGIVSSTLGVAGGELIIPTLIFIFGIGVKIAGTASLLISLPTIWVGLYRYYRSRNFFDWDTATQIVFPMGIGSVFGSILGGLLLGLVSQNALKMILGGILIYSATRMFLRRHPVNPQNEAVGQKTR